MTDKQKTIIYQKPSASTPHCPFCTIVRNFPPTHPLTDTCNSNPAWDPDKLMPPSYVLLSTDHVIAFLDIAPLTRGHVLVAPRNHRIKVGDLKSEESSEIGRLLPLIARAVTRAVLPDIPHAEVDYNIVQNNGPGAAQVVPHVHYHVIPRPPLNYQPPSPKTLQTLQARSVPTIESTQRQSGTTTTSVTDVNQSHSKKSDVQQGSSYPPNDVPTGLKRSYIQFGRGVRHELDDDDALELVEEMRRCVAEEWYRDFGSDVPGEMDLRKKRRGEKIPEKL